ncbi:MAG: hypothetical protein WCU90_15115, partial [Kiritimatiellia bacterium]
MKRLWVILLYGMGVTLAARSGAVRFDFESGDLQGWEVVEGAFGRLVSDRTKEHHGGAPYTKVGTFFLSTLESADGTRPDDRFEGVIESPVVVLESPEVTLRVGGGKGDGVYVALCTLDGREVAAARGANSQTLQAHSLSVPACVGQPVFFRVVDRAVGSWGHITLDHVSCQGRVDAQASARRFEARRREVARVGNTETVDRLRAGIRELGVGFPGRYPAAALLLRLDALDADGDAGALEAFAREALVRENPLLNPTPVLFVTRKQYRPDHHNTATLFVSCEINARSYDTEG